MERVHLLMEGCHKIDLEFLNRYHEAEIMNKK